MPHTEYGQSCPKCFGRGHVQCKSCHGTGSERCTWCNGSGVRTIGEERTQCSFCHGSGHEQCSSCHGRGLRQCKECDGHGQIVYFIEVGVAWRGGLRSRSRRALRTISSIGSSMRMVCPMISSIKRARRFWPSRVERWDRV